MIRRLVWAALALALIAGFAWALWPRPVEVETAEVGRQDIVVTVDEEGRSRIREVFAVSAPIAGRMARLDLHPGDPVTVGETVVARLRPAAPPLLDVRARRVAEAARDAAQAALGLARAELERARAQADYAASELRRAGALADRGTLATRTLEQARLDAAASAALESANANVMMRQRELESARAALIEGDEASGDGPCCVEVSAPTTGCILRVLAESEQVVAAGTPLLEIGDPSDLEIVVDLLSSDAVRVTEGRPATLDGWGGATLAAHVARVDPSAETKVSALGIEEQRVTAVLALDGPAAAQAGLGDGYGVTTHIEVWRGEDLPAVPVGALFRNGEDWAVFRVEEGRAWLTPIGLGERNADWAEVRTGLEPGASVILHPGDRIADGVRVAPRAVPRD
ncbi:efflux RND transporter periplasmic adaptor subunit [Rubellimicrobium mesophilum]|nr:HlyD family efflux transporter periplasmic adaptor subunit [Rubellimicrobium mesophilum]